jgi:hypothetical protein
MLSYLIGLVYPIIYMQVVIIISMNDVYMLLKYQYTYALCTLSKGVSMHQCTLCVIVILILSNSVVAY